MAKISTYTVETPTSSDLVIGTDDVGGTNATKNFTVGSIAGIANLQSVLDAGNTATEDISLTGNLSVTGTVADSSGDVGTNGQILTSTGTGTNWVDSASLQQVSITIPSADFNLLHTVAYPVIDAPGANKAIQIVSCAYQMTYVSSPYSFAATGVEIEVSPGSAQVLIANTVTNSITNLFVNVNLVASGTITENSALKLTAPAPQTSTAGDSDVTLHLLYRIITV